MIQAHFIHTSFSGKDLKRKTKEACFSGVIREEPPSCRHCFVSLSNPRSIIKDLTAIAVFTVSSHLAKWPGNNTQMKWQAIKSKYRSCKEKQNSLWRQGYLFCLFIIFNFSLEFKCAWISLAVQKDKEDPLKTLWLNPIILSLEENKQTKKPPAHFPDLGLF